VSACGRRVLGKKKEKKEPEKEKKRVGKFKKKNNSEGNIIKSMKRFKELQ